MKLIGDLYFENHNKEKIFVKLITKLTFELPVLLH
jgi:hypothetical protein